MCVHTNARRANFWWKSAVLFLFQNLTHNLYFHVVYVLCCCTTHRPPTTVPSWCPSRSISPPISTFTRPPWVDKQSRFWPSYRPRVWVRAKRRSVCVFPVSGFWPWFRVFDIVARWRAVVYGFWWGILKNDRRWVWTWLRVQPLDGDRLWIVNAAARWRAWGFEGGKIWILRSDWRGLSDGKLVLARWRRVDF